jgi:hypothetical protein
MRRRASNRPTFGWSEYNVRTDVDKEQLQLIGAICLEWNFVEDMLDYALFNVWEMDWNASVEVASRINGMEGKFAIIKSCVRNVKRHPELIPSIVDITIDAVAEYKRYRDGVIHARLLHPKSGVATTSVNRGRADEVLVSKDALDGLLTRLQILSCEMVALANALAYTFIDDFDTAPGRYVQFSPRPV